MTDPIEELDLARAKAIAWEDYRSHDYKDGESEALWRDLDLIAQQTCLGLAKAIRESDAERGLMVVPLEPSYEMTVRGNDANVAWGTSGQPKPRAIFIWDAMLAASPYAEK